jgi:hypothetical protein
MSISMEELHKLRMQMVERGWQPIEELPPMRVEQDLVNHPPHYTASSIEPIDVIEAWGLGFHLGSALKYIARCELKGRPIEDLEKARWYLDREIARRKGVNGKSS